jgi:hypothetical protein
MADDERAGQGDGGGGGGALLGSPSHHVACFNGPAHTWVYGLIFRGGLSAIEDRRVAALHGPLEKNGALLYVGLILRFIKSVIKNVDDSDLYDQSHHMSVFIGDYNDRTIRRNHHHTSHNTMTTVKQTKPNFNAHSIHAWS